MNRKITSLCAATTLLMFLPGAAADDPPGPECVDPNYSPPGGNLIVPGLYASGDFTGWMYVGITPGDVVAPIKNQGAGVNVACFEAIGECIDQIIKDGECDMLRP